MDDNQNPQENLNPQEGSNNQGSSQIVNIDIAEEMKAAYIDYSMSVIVSRAIPTFVMNEACAPQGALRNARTRTNLQ